MDSGEGYSEPIKINCDRVPDSVLLLIYILADKIPLNIDIETIKQIKQNLQSKLIIEGT